MSCWESESAVCKSLKSVLRCIIMIDVKNMLLNFFKGMFQMFKKLWYDMIDMIHKL